MSNALVTRNSRQQKVDEMKRRNIAVVVLIVAIFIVIYIVFSPLQGNELKGIYHPSFEYCQNIRNPTTRAFCFSYIADIQNDSKICENLTYDKEVMFYCKAVTLKNSTFCIEISNNDLRKICYGSTNVTSG